MLKTLAAAFCLLIAASSSTGAEEPQSVVESYFAAWNTRDLDGIMEYVADDAALELDQLGVLRKGKDEIREGFEAMLSKSDWTIEISHFETDGNKVD